MSDRAGDVNGDGSGMVVECGGALDIYNVTMYLYSPVVGCIGNSEMDVV
jgi:hypothetical protein